MFDSKVSDWNIVQRSVYKKDPLKMLADECHVRESSFSFIIRSWIGITRTTLRGAELPGTTAGQTEAIGVTYLDDYMDGQLRRTVDQLRTDRRYLV